MVDKPVSIAGELPAHLDAFIVYANHVRSADVKNISSERLTELWAAIRSDIDGSRAYCDHKDLKLLGDRIDGIVKSARATLIDVHSLQAKDLENLEEARNLAYSFQHRVIDLSVQRELKLLDADGNLANSGVTDLCIQPNKR